MNYIVDIGYDARRETTAFKFMNSSFIQLNKKGKVIKGDSVGSFVIIREESMGFIILISRDCNFQSNVYDSWVEDMDSLEQFFEESDWQVDWYE